MIWQWSFSFVFPIYFAMNTMHMLTATANHYSTSIY